jgi:two-component system, chemotaxis family, protein-glutamate methylesterase/glutaminase
MIDKSASKIGVLVVDDSALVRHLMTALINAQPDMQVVGVAHDAYQAREMIRDLNPDVLTLDIEMPRMDGLDFLDKLMRLRPMPVVMVSTLTERGADVTMRALELGAVDFVTKPKLTVSHGLADAGAEIADKIRVAARVRVVRRTTLAPVVPNKPPAARVVALNTPIERGTERLVAIGASTGGTEAIRSILVDLPSDFPPLVITQHMPAGFTRSFAQRLDGLCRIHVKEADHGERLQRGHAYIAPGGLHMRVARSGSDYQLRLDDGEAVNRHRPSVEVLFRSVAEQVGRYAVGVMLTGMGRDGAQAMREMRDAGAFNIAQDEATSVVYGMPREAVAAGAVHLSVALNDIAGLLVGRLAAGTPAPNRA